MLTRYVSNVKRYYVASQRLSSAAGGLQPTPSAARLPRTARRLQRNV